MENIFDKFKKLNLDTSPIGLSIELREPFFCTPIGAQIIGWDNGIHYIKKLQKDFPYKEIKFTDDFYNITGLTRQENI